MNSINRIGLLAAILVIIAGAGWAALNILGEDNSGAVALIKADNTNYKEKPQDAQGMDIPHQDVMVFNGGANKPGQQVEKIMPPPEQPLLATEPSAEPSADTNAASAAASQAKPADAEAQAKAQAMGRAVEPVPNAPLPAPESNGKSVSVDVPAAIPAPAFDPSKGAKNVVQPAAQAVSKAMEKAKEEVKQAAQQEASAPATQPSQDVQAAVPTSSAQPVEEKKVEAKSEETSAPSLAMEPVAKQVKAQAKSVGGSRFQLASFNDRPSAERAAAQLAKKYNTALDGAALNVVQGSAHGRTVYRVQGSASSASGVCSSIQSSGGNCMVVK